MKKERISTTIDLILLLIFTVSSVFLCIQINLGNYISIFWQIILILVLLGILIVFFLWLSSKNMIWLQSILLVFLSLSFGYASIQLDRMRNENDGWIKTHYRMNLVTTHSSFESSMDMKDSILAIMVNDRNHMQSFSDLNESFKTESCEIREFHNMSAMIRALEKNEIQGMILSDYNLVILQQLFPKIFEQLKILNENIHEVEVAHKGKNASIDEPISILMTLSDIDQLSYASSTSMCLILFIDPIDSTFTVIQIPNNLYIPNVAYDSYPDALHNVSYNGIDNLLYSLESIFDIEFDYFIKTNQETIFNAVDIMQGIHIQKESCDESCEWVSEFYDYEKVIDYYNQTQDIHSILEGIFNKRDQLTAAKLINFTNNYEQNTFTNFTVHELKEYIHLLNDGQWSYEKVDMTGLKVAYEPCISFNVDYNHEVKIIDDEFVNIIYSYFTKMKHLENMSQFEFNLNQMENGILIPKSNDKLITVENMAWKISSYFAFLPDSIIQPIDVEKWQGKIHFDKPNFNPDLQIEPIN